MKKFFTIAGLSIIFCQFLQAQGVKQLWGLNVWGDQIFSIDTANGNYSLRKQLQQNCKPIDFTILGGNVYGTQSAGWFLYKFDPMSADADNITGIVPNGLLETGGLAPVSHLTKKDNTIFGATNMAIRTREFHNPDYIEYDFVPIYSFNTSTQEFSETISGMPPELDGARGSMTEWNGKFYGLTEYGGTYDLGNIYEFDPSTNLTRSVVSIQGIQLTNSEYIPYRKLTLVGNKFYGLGLNALFEWDPVGTTIEIKHTFNSAGDGLNALGSLVEKNGKLYGVTATGGSNDKGVLFEYDPSGNTYTKRKDLNDYNLGVGADYSLVFVGDNLYGIFVESEIPFNSKLLRWNINTDEVVITGGFPPSVNLFRSLQSVSAPVAMFAAGICTSFSPVTINASNNNTWVPITDSKGDVLAEIHAHGNNLGILDIQAYINNTAVRTDEAGHPYLDRNITITPENQPAEGNPVEVRLYITKQEFETLKAAQNSGINDISDLSIFKSNNGCASPLINALPVVTTYEDYEFGYVIKASITSFSTFYFSSRTFEALPLQLLNFSGTSQNNDIELYWETDNEHNTLNFEVERSTDGIHFAIVGKVIANNSPGKNHYQFTDKDIDNLSASTVYYRLNQKDIDGKSAYSKIIAVAVQATKIFTINPNPANDYVILQLSKQSSAGVTLIQIIDIGGRKVMEQKVNMTSSTCKINISSLSNGVYMISAINNGNRFTGKFVKRQ